MSGDAVVAISNSFTVTIKITAKVKQQVRRTLEDRGVKANLVMIRMFVGAIVLAMRGHLAEVTDVDQRTPAFILQLNTIVRRAVDLASSKDRGFLSIDHLRPMSSWEQIGRYISFPSASGVVAWIGTDFRRWKERGRTPLWLKFPPGKWGRAPEVQVLLEPWADRKGIAYTADNEGMTVGIDLVTSEEMDLTVKSVVDFLRNISTELSGLSRSQVFVQLVNHIRSNGFEGQFYRQRFTYYEEGGLVYWTMGAPLDETTIVNRCKKEESYEFRARSGRLPE